MMESIAAGVGSFGKKAALCGVAFLATVGVLYACNTGSLTSVDPGNGQRTPALSGAPIDNYNPPAEPGKVDAFLSQPDMFTPSWIAECLKDDRVQIENDPAWVPLNDTTGKEIYLPGIATGIKDAEDNVSKKLLCVDVNGTKQMRPLVTIDGRPEWQVPEGPLVPEFDLSQGERLFQDGETITLQTAGDPQILRPYHNLKAQTLISLENPKEVTGQFVAHKDGTVWFRIPCQKTCDTKPFEDRVIMWIKGAFHIQVPKK